MNPSWVLDELLSGHDHGRLWVLTEADLGKVEELRFSIEEG
jgi:hypothetical protein